MAYYILQKQYKREKKFAAKTYKALMAQSTRNDFEYASATIRSNIFSCEL